MNGSEFLEKLNGIDEDLIQEASQKRAGTQRKVRLRWTAIAACLVLALGVTAYATDLFGVIFSGKPELGSITVVGADGETTEYITRYYDVSIPSVKRGLIKGEVKKLTDVIKKQIDADKKGEYVAAPPNSYPLMPNFYSVTGLSAEEAVKYVGYKYLEPLWFPYENYATCVEAMAGENDRGQCQLEMIMVTASNYDESGARLSPEKLTGWLTVDAGVYISVNSDGTPYHTQLGGFDDEGSYEITNANGYTAYVCETPKALTLEDHRELYGGLIKNGLYYMISINFSENNRAEAERIVREWAEHF